MIGYKIVYRAKDKLWSFNRGFVFYEERINRLKKEGLILEYGRGRTTKPIDDSMPLTAFKNYSRAIDVFDDNQQHRLSSIQLWKCSIKISHREPQKRLEPFNFCFVGKYKLENLLEEEGIDIWPEGTVFCSEIKLVERIK